MSGVFSCVVGTFYEKRKFLKQVRIKVSGQLAQMKFLLSLALHRQGKFLRPILF